MTSNALSTEQCPQLLESVRSIAHLTSSGNSCYVTHRVFERTNSHFLSNLPSPAIGSWMIWKGNLWSLPAAEWKDTTHMTRLLRSLRVSAFNLGSKTRQLDQSLTVSMPHASKCSHNLILLHFPKCIQQCVLCDSGFHDMIIFGVCSISPLLFATKSNFYF